MWADCRGACTKRPRSAGAFSAPGNTSRHWCRSSADDPAGRSPPVAGFADLRTREDGIAPLRSDANLLELAIDLIPGAMPAGLSLAVLCGVAHNLEAAPVTSAPSDG